MNQKWVNSRPRLLERRIPVTRMQSFVMAKRLDGQTPAQIADLIGVGVRAIYKRDYRGRRKMAKQQRARYVEALTRNTGRRPKLKPLSLNFT